MLLLWSRNKERNRRGSLAVRSKHLGVWSYPLCDYLILSASIQCQPLLRLFILVLRLFFASSSYPWTYCSVSWTGWLQLPSSYCSCLELYTSYLSAFCFLIYLAISSSLLVLLLQVSSVLPPPPVCCACSFYILLILLFFFFPYLMNLPQGSPGPASPWLGLLLCLVTLFTFQIPHTAYVLSQSAFRRGGKRCVLYSSLIMF